MRPQPPARRSVLALLGSCGLTLAGCVTEQVTRPTRGTPVLPGGGQHVRPGDLVSPAGVPSLSSRARFAVAPLGVVRYDGLTLPLVSPDGRRLASQVHQPPGWPGLLATPGDSRSALCGIAIYALGSGNALLTDAAAAVPRGLILGRHADDTGFLIESPQPGDSRWIGRCDWTTGEVTWLVQQEGVCAAHAIALRDGTLVYTARKAGETVAALMIAAPGKEPARFTLEGASFMFPLATPSQRHVAALLVGRNGLELVFVEVGAADGPRQGARCWLGADGSPVAAFGAVASIQAAPPMGGAADWGALADVVAAVAPRFGRTVLVSAPTGAVTQLERRTVGAAPVVAKDIRGLLISTEQDLRFASLISEATELVVAPSPARVLSDPFVCRALGAKTPSFVALGLHRTPTEPSLLVMALSLAE